MEITVNVAPDYREGQAGGAIITFTSPVTFVELTQEGKEALIVLLQAVPSVRPQEVVAHTDEVRERPTLRQQLEESITEEELGAKLCDWVQKRFIDAGMHYFTGQARHVSEMGSPYVLFALHKQDASMSDLSDAVMKQVDELIAEAKEDGYDTILWRVKPQYNDGKLRFRYHFTTYDAWVKKVGS